METPETVRFPTRVTAVPDDVAEPGVDVGATLADGVGEATTVAVTTAVGAPVGSTVGDAVAPGDGAGLVQPEITKIAAINNVTGRKFILIIIISINYLYIF